MIINMTPHTMIVNGTEYKSQGIIRAEQEEVKIEEIDGIDIIKLKFGKPINLPEYKPGVYYIVSLIVANAARDNGRTTEDLLVSAKPIRDKKGRIIGCKALSKI